MRKNGSMDMQKVKVDQITYEWHTYETDKYNGIYGFNFDGTNAQVLEIKGVDYDFHIVMRVCKYDGYFSLGTILCFGSVLSKDYSVVESGVRLFLYRPRLNIAKGHDIESKHIQSILQHINSDRFRPFIADVRGDWIDRKALPHEVKKIS